VTSSDRECPPFTPATCPLYARSMPENGEVSRDWRPLQISETTLECTPWAENCPSQRATGLTEVGVGVSHPRQPNHWGWPFERLSKHSIISARKGQSDWTRKRLRTLGSVFIAPVG